MSVRFSLKHLFFITNALVCAIGWYCGHFCLNMSYLDPNISILCMKWSRE
jgi:hypothetical protein